MARAAQPALSGILVDHNIEGQALVLWGVMNATGWSDLLPVRLLRFTDVGLPHSSSDRMVWRFVQARHMLLLTDNRRNKEADALEQTIREENTAMSLPVLTIGNVRRLNEGRYREQCVLRLLEIVIDLDIYRGVGRLFIP